MYRRKSALTIARRPRRGVPQAARPRPAMLRASSAMHERRLKATRRLGLRQGPHFLHRVGEFLRFVQCLRHFVSYKVFLLGFDDYFERQSR
jgi:hypothetical protein